MGQLAGAGWERHTCREAGLAKSPTTQVPPPVSEQGDARGPEESLHSSSLNPTTCPSTRQHSTSLLTVRLERSPV